MQVDKKHQEELLNFMQIIRPQRHDFNFHMQAVSGLIENQKYEECENYIHTMVKNVEGLNQMLPFANPAVAALVNAFYELMSTKNIRFKSEVLDPLDEIPCTVYEINTIIRNFLQNAIDEVERLCEEMTAQKIHKRCKGIPCNGNHSCPDELTHAIELCYEEMGETL